MIPVLFLSMIAVGQMPQKHDDLSRLIARCERMEYLEFSKLVHDLGRRNEREALLALAQSSRLRFCGCAADEYCRTLSAPDAIAYVQSLPPGRPLWRHAYMALGKQKVSDLAAFIAAEMRSDDPNRKAMCYTLCADRKWPILLQDAIDDLKSAAVPQIADPDESFTSLGDYASHYLRTVTGKPIKAPQRRVPPQESQDSPP